MLRSLHSSTLRRFFHSSKCVMQELTQGGFNPDPLPTPIIRLDDTEEASQETFKNMVSFRDDRAIDVLMKKHEHSIMEFINENRTVFEAIDEMTTKKVGALLVMDNNEQMSGIMTERDYLMKIALKGLSSKQTSIKNIMTTNVFCVRENASVSECLQMMTFQRFRHLPVKDANGKILGMISIGDLVKTILVEQKQTIEYLRDYVERTY